MIIDLGISSADTSWVDFWNGLCTATYANEVLELKRGLFVDRDNKAIDSALLYIRKSYVDLTNLIINEKRVIITGTPGIGITMFRNYLAYFLQTQFDDIAIIFDRGDSDDGVLLTRVRGILEAKSGNKKLLVNKSVTNSPIYCLTDVSNEDLSKILTNFTSTGPVNLFLFSSPNSKLDNILKQNTTIFYLPLWTEVELLKAAELLKLELKQEVVKARFDNYGGVVRIVFGDPKTYETNTEVRIPNAVADFDFAASRVIGYNSGQKNLVHRLIYMDVDEKFGLKSYSWGSDYLLGLIAERGMRLLQKEALDLVSALASEEVITIRGHLFERICHLVLFNSHLPFRCRRLGHKSKQIVWLKGGYLDLTLLSQNKILHRINRNDSRIFIETLPFSYFLPYVFNYPVVDSAFKIDNKMLVYFQITIAKVHSSNSDEFVKVAAEVAQQFSMTDIHIIFVVPHRDFETYVPPNIKVGDLEVKLYVLDINTPQGRPPEPNQSTSFADMFSIFLKIFK